MSDEFSVGELGQIVAEAAFYPKAPPSEEVDLVIRRLRNWSVAGALVPTADPFIGSGKHRRYDRSALYIAVVLNGLASNDQTVGILVKVGQYLRNLEGPEPLLAGTEISLWQQAKSGAASVFLVHAGGRRPFRPDPPLVGLTDFAIQALVPAGKVVETLQKLGPAIVIELTSLFAPLRQ